MNTSFTFETEPLAGHGTTPSFLEALESGDSETDPFAFSPGEAEALAYEAEATTECKGYEPGETQKSRTEKGLLTTDVVAHNRGLLVADLGVDWRTPRASLKHDKALRDWLATIPQVIRVNPTTTIRISGFSDCVGSERNNAFLRRGRAFKLCALLREMLGGGARWNNFKSRVTFLGGAPLGEYIASNATVEGRARNRSVLIENVRTVDFDPRAVTACLISPAQATAYPLLGVIPNVPDHQKHVPIEYKLDAKKIIGKLAQDVSSGRHTIHKWLDGAHLGIAGLEMFIHGSALVSGLAIAGPVIGMVANFMALGMGCADAAEIVATNWAATGYSRGVVMGADKRPASMVKDYFANDFFRQNPTCPQARNVSMANYKMGLLVGYAHGSLLCPNQRAIFFKDLGRRIGDMSHLGDPKTWGRKQRIDWYVKAAANFRKYHLA